ncbi:hypothetical protein F5Y10DRAFT_234225 [Nemania abortiva]|nr:hypothetical protein F5Y10DRAFT_234225 [Nemania abortiva]
MAEASCGPSNAFKGLARHIEQDRSHQQDRVAPGFQNPAQNFRSTPLNSGLADQFSAFQQQNAVALQHSSPLAQMHPIDNIGNIAPAPAKAATFSAPQPTQLPPALARSAAAGANWVHDFQRMNINTPAHHCPAIRINAYSPFSQELNMLPLVPSVTSPPTSLHPINQSMHAPPYLNNATPVFDTQAQARLDQEFEDAMNEWMLHNAPESEMSGQDELNAQTGVDLSASLDAASAEPAAQEAPKEDTADDQNQDTELARAAQQLVDSVADNDSEKFKNSEFLALMRRIASQQLTVQGNDLVERPQPPSSADTSLGS